MEPDKSLSGCTFGILGDSYSTFRGYIPQGYSCYYPNVNVDDVRRVEDTWWHQLMELTGMQLVVNDSYSGATVCTHVRDDHPKAAAFVERAKHAFSGETQLDYIIVFGGTNDNWVGRTVGQLQFADWSEEDLRQVLPAFCQLFHQLTSRYPQTTVVSVVNTGLKPEVITGMEQAAAHYDVVNIRLANVQKQNGHPTAQGMRQIAEQILAALQK